MDEAHSFDYKNQDEVTFCAFRTAKTVDSLEMRSFIEAFTQFDFIKNCGGVGVFN